MDRLPEPAIPFTPALTRTYGGNGAFYNFYNDYSHITDPNLRRRLALAEIDKARTGFFTDSYDIFAINLITGLLGLVYWQGPPIPGSSYGGNNGILPQEVNTALKAATSGGTVIGQLVFGWLADKMGRRRMYGIELAIIVLSTFAQALAAPSSVVTMTGLMIFWRVLMGIGIGGDYPLSAVITSEFAPTRWRGAMMAAVFSMQGTGQFAAALVALITTVCFKGSFISTTTPGTCHESCQVAADRSWRIIIAFGGIPACFALYWRLTIPETPRYTFDVAHDIEKAHADIRAYVNNQPEGKVDPILQQQTKRSQARNLAAPEASWPDAFSYFSQWKNFKVLFGTTASWFFLDLAFYGIGLNNGVILGVIGYASGDTVYNTLFNNALGSLILVCAGSIPGYWLSVLTVDTLGRKSIQIVGFFILTIIFCIIGFAYDSLSSGALLALYILAQVFFNFGPNTTTFLVPGECFPTRYRATGHGISAAGGKIGAIVAQVMAQPLLTKGAASDCKGHACQPWLDHLMQLFALFMLCGTATSFLIPETKGRTLEELSGERPPDYRNGSTTLDDGPGGGWLNRINIFGGGKPAGFSTMRSPSLLPRSPGLRGRKERVGIMTSPELLPKKGEKRKKSHTKAGSFESGADPLRHSASSNGRHDDRDDAYISRGSGGVFPGWGAGWTVQGGSSRERVGGDGIMLHDVGSLLK
ncbi:MFS general substrate transporter [Venustampulla echinocandica]|uniref:MFS general substrate transporter n=1 Tax=Venustampulla echinocandica TaxID=2656787 RepID=A0A370TL29_9HELO|nr:MFS general substrate transporter [Venustampulla echinocandica]RDL36231.1 MFS general substrate transporter [Venustampulla echinocandica]